jgi:leucyl/phenylalanyl-tRNA--protein transferase
MPIEPPTTRWQLPDPRTAGGDDIVGIGADLEPGTILSAYRSGMFPMPIHRKLAWWSPDPRGVLPIDGLRVSRSLRRSCRQYEVRIDTAFEEVIAACADPRRPNGWIDRRIVDAYVGLHRLGWAHSVEAWSLDDGRLAGGLYGLVIGGLFAGESMFHWRTDASKVALVHLVGTLQVDGGLLDVQWCTDHLASLGVIEVPREDYLTMLAGALELPTPAAFSGAPPSERPSP